MRKLFIAIMAIAAIALVGCKDKEEPKNGGEVNIDCSLPADVEAVDLGLPSGLKWANMNVGATKPEEYGAYFAWGETSPKEVYDWITYKWCHGSFDTQTKYCMNSFFGTADYKTVLEPADDAARVNWGGNWRMPTCAEQEELQNNCTWTWTTQNGVNGYLVTSKINSNSIFLPAAGFRGFSMFFGVGSCGCYWSSSLYKSYSDRACFFFFDSNSVGWDHYRERFDGQSVRAVCNNQ